MTGGITNLPCKAKIQRSPEAGEDAGEMKLNATFTSLLLSYGWEHAKRQTRVSLPAGSNQVPVLGCSWWQLRTQNFEGEETQQLCL